AYAAIREAAPGGLGSAQEQDVAGEPTVTLREAMALAADRDSVAREYATGYALTFERSVPALQRARRAGLAWPETIVQAYLELLAEVPDTLVARKRGVEAAKEMSREARRALEAGGMHTSEGCRAVADLDRAWRDDSNAKNPGTTADLVAAGLFVLWWIERGGV
ncbi:MAG: triphosphoribosyl-dephospho-CoA synthase, partial [Gemmatimonadota bacterium]